MKTDSLQPPEGLGTVLEMVIHCIDPRAAEPEIPGGRAGTLAGLRKTMQERLHADLREGMAAIRRSMFILLPDQAATLERLGIPRETREGVRALGCLMTPRAEHSVATRLTVIATMPPTPEGGVADWRRWWLEWHTERVGVPRPQDHDPLRDPVAETLNTVIAAMAREAEPAIPGPGDAARHILRRRAEEPRKRGERTEGPERTLRLSEVWAAGVRIGWLAHGIGLPAGAVPARWGSTPEEVADALSELGIPFRRDTGTVAGIRELRDILQREGIRKTWLGHDRTRWHDAEAADGWIVSHPLGRSLGEETREGAEPEKGGNPPEREADAPGPIESELIRIAAPRDPRAGGSSPDLAEMAAFVNRTTPDSAREYLAGRAADPGPGELTPCPRAGGCAALCGVLQAAGEFSFPLTPDGDHSSCAYQAFLARYGRLNAGQREEAARALIKPTLERRKREAALEMRRLGIHAAVTGREEEPGDEPVEGLEGEPGPEPAAGGEARGAAAGTDRIQPSLF